MRRIIGLTLVMFLFGCTAFDGQESVGGEASVLDFEGTPEEKGAENILLITGEGGPSGAMFIKAAETYKRQHGGVIYQVKSGDEFVEAMANFVQEYGQIDHMEYFGHGNHVGLYVNQAPNVNGGVYANDPALNENYLAASIYELPDDLFAKYGWIKFNGCNVAMGYPEKNSLAQSFANYFDVDVVAPRGPTEFSKNPFSVDPIENSNYLDPAFNGDVYMVSTYSDKDFIVVKAQESIDLFKDVRMGQSYDEAVSGLMKRGLKLNFKPGEFLPYKNVTYGEARQFCLAVFKDEGKCLIPDGKEDVLMRNLKALQLLTDSYGVALKYTNPWYDSYIWWANNQGVLTDEFTTKKWYTRGEMAELSWNFVTLLQE
ncbi:hypothetical protein HY605_05525 [Candidatus Peregrinibacteria bacterium]|nr:hypothetical protein [Candidatus Peregrinibacteria bacterium]